MGRKQRDRVLQFVDHLVGQATAVMVARLQVAEGDARHAATEIARRICDVYGKSIMYVPSADDFRRDDRDREIWAQYGQEGPDGVRPYTVARLEQLAAEHGLTRQQMYNITRLQHRLQVASRQGNLPGLDPDDQPA